MESYVTTSDLKPTSDEAIGSSPGPSTDLNRSFETGDGGFKSISETQPADADSAATDDFGFTVRIMTQ
jgi:hypothetical protein